MNNAKKYGLYQQNSLDSVSDEDISDLSNYPQDSYVKPSENKNVGKLDEYNKEKNYNQQKARVILNESKIIPSDYDNTNKIDDFIPADIGNAIDNVFSKVDGLLNKTGKFLFGSGQKKSVSKPVVQRPVSQPIKKVETQKQNVQQNQVQVTQPQIQNINNNRAQTNITSNNTNYNLKQEPQNNFEVKQNVQQSSVVKKVIKKSEVVDEGPKVSRSTYISELDLPIEILNDPDLVKYFDQMKLYEKKVSGGLSSRTFSEVEEILKKGRWGKLFMISFDKLKINTMMSSPEAGYQRFVGMSPVYKALGRNFTNTEELKKAIENDINSYLKTGEGSKDFHKFTYKIARK